MARKAKRPALEAKVDLTPMIDVVFQLIIFFVVTVNLEQESIIKDMKLPDAPYSREQKSRPPGQITIQVSKKGHFYIGSGARFTRRQLGKVLRSAVRLSRGEIPVLIRGDERSQHRAIRQAMDECAAAGLYRIRFAATKKKGG